MNALLYGYLNILNWSKDEKGQDLVEYVLILGLIAIAAVAGITAAGGGIQAAWNAVAGSVNAALTTP